MVPAAAARLRNEGHRGSIKNEHVLAWGMADIFGGVANDGGDALLIGSHVAFWALSFLILWTIWRRARTQRRRVIYTVAVLPIIAVANVALKVALLAGP
jgi:hypothetical protein